MKKLVGLLVFSGSLILCAGAELVSAWDFNTYEPGKLVNASVGDMKASVRHPEHIKTVPGKLGNALSFHGSKKGNNGGLLVRNFKFDFTQPFTVEAIVMFDPNIKRNQCREIFNITDSERGPGVRLNFFYDSIALRSGDGKKDTFTGTGNTKNRVAVGKWQMVTVTYDGKFVAIYLDGAAAVRKEMTIKPSQKMKHLTIGSYRVGYSYPLTGALDDLKFYKGCKTPAEVAAQYIAVFGE